MRRKNLFRDAFFRDYKAQLQRLPSPHVSARNAKSQVPIFLHLWASNRWEVLRAMANKLKASGIMKDAAERLYDMQPVSIEATIKQVEFSRKFQCYVLRSAERRRPQFLSAAMVHTLADAYGDDCNEWKGKPIILVHSELVHIRVPERDDTIHEDKTPVKGKPVLTVVPRRARN
jgi:hypothetical protein